MQFFDESVTHPHSNFAVFFNTAGDDFLRVVESIFDGHGFSIDTMYCEFGDLDSWDEAMRFEGVECGLGNDKDRIPVEQFRRLAIQALRIFGRLQLEKEVRQNVDRLVEKISMACVSHDNGAQYIFPAS
jgi:hypothetical protein